MEKGIECMSRTSKGKERGREEKFEVILLSMCN